MENSKKRNVSEENGMFNATWADSFAFIADETGSPVYYICKEKLENNKKSNVAKHFQNKHAAFAQKDPDEDERKKDISKLGWKVHMNKNNSKNWIVHEIVRHGRPFNRQILFQ